MMCGGAMMTRSSAYTIWRNLPVTRWSTSCGHIPWSSSAGFSNRIRSSCPRKSFCRNFANGEPGRLRRSRRRPDMEEQLKHPGEEIRRLRGCVNDLVSVTTLPAMWSGSERSQIVRTLLDVLLEMLHLDFVYLRLEEPTGQAPTEMALVARPQSLMADPRQIGEWLRRCLGEDPQNWPSSVRNRIGDEDISIVPLRLGLQGEIGFIAAGSQRLDFPGLTERLLLGVAANQATIGLQGARLLSEQKRIAR